MSGSAPYRVDDAPPDAALRDVYRVLEARWREAVATDAVLFRYVISHEERDWLMTFLGGPLDRTTRVFRVETAFDDPRSHGLLVSHVLAREFEKESTKGVSAWRRPEIPQGLSSEGVLALLVASFAHHYASTWMKTVAFVVEPKSFGKREDFERWMEGFLRLLSQHCRTARFIVLDDVAHPSFGRLAERLGPQAISIVPALHLGERISAMVEASADTTRSEGQMRVLCVQAMLAVSEGRVDRAEQLASTIEAVADASGSFAPVIPVRFSIGAGLLAQGLLARAVASYRAAEAAAERAQAAGDPQGLELRIFSRFGVGAALLSSKEGLLHAAKYDEETAPLCVELGDVRLEIDAHRMAGVAHERRGDLKEAWEAAVRALSCLPRVPEADRRDGAMAPLADWMLALTNPWTMRSYRKPLETKLAELGVEPSGDRG